MKKEARNRRVIMLIMDISKIGTTCKRYSKRGNAEK
jgi:hypothetical protein